MNNQNNALLNNFYRHQQMKIPFQQNNLLKNNPAFMANMQYNQSQQLQQMKMMQMQQHMQQMKMAQELKKREKEKMNNLKNLEKMNKDDITKAIIQPENSKLTKKEKEDIEINFNELEDKYGTEDKYRKHLKKYWDQRTNQPYKNILKDENYQKKFENKEDLIVYKVTDLDKDEEKLEHEFQEKDSLREKHNNELKMIYSTSKEAENKKKFEYNNVYKFRMKFNPKDHQEKKQNKIDYYKKEQKKLEAGNKKFSEVIEHLVNNSIFDKDQLKNLGITTKDNEINVDIDKIEEVDKEMRKAYGEEYDNLMKELEIEEEEDKELDRQEQERKIMKEKIDKTGTKTVSKVVTKTDPKPVPKAEPKTLLKTSPKTKPNTSSKINTTEKTPKKAHAIIKKKKI